MFLDEENIKKYTEEMLNNHYWKTPIMEKILKYKKLNSNAITPTIANIGDVGLDLYAIKINVTKDYIEYDTGIAVEFPAGYFGILVPRSSITKMDLLIPNGVGIIDCGYRGSLRFRYKRIFDLQYLLGYIYTKIIRNEPSEFFSEKFNLYNIGERIGQLIILPKTNVTLVESELSETIRADGGFGSSG